MDPVDSVDIDQIELDVTQVAAPFVCRYSPQPGLAPDEAQAQWSEWVQNLDDHIQAIEQALISEELDPTEFKNEAEHILRNIVKFSPEGSLENSLHLLLFTFGDQESQVLTLDEMLAIIRETNEKAIIDLLKPDYVNALWGAKVFTINDTQTLQFILENTWKTMNSSEESWRGQKLANLSFFIKLTIESQMLERNSVSRGVVTFILKHSGERAPQKTLGILRSWLEQEES